MKDGALDSIFMLCIAAAIAAMSVQSIVLRHRIADLEKKVMVDEIAFATWTHMTK